MIRTGQGRFLGLAALAVAALGTGATAAADPQMRRLDADRVMITDFSGRPPFKRRIVQVDDLSPTEFARFEALAGEPRVDEARIGQRIQVVDFRGRPPFRRQSVEITSDNAVTFARFEETVETDRRPARPRFPGKQFPVRR